MVTLDSMWIGLSRSDFPGFYGMFCGIAEVNMRWICKDAFYFSVTLIVKYVGFWGGTVVLDLGVYISARFGGLSILSFI